MKTSSQDGGSYAKHPTLEFQYIASGDKAVQRITYGTWKPCSSLAFSEELGVLFCIQSDGVYRWAKYGRC